MSVVDRAIWLESARVRSLIGANRGTIESLRSGLACYFAFVGTGIFAGACVLVSQSCDCVCQTKPTQR